MGLMISGLEERDRVENERIKQLLAELQRTRSQLHLDAPRGASGGKETLAGSSPLLEHQLFTLQTLLQSVFSSPRRTRTLPIANLLSSLSRSGLFFT